MRDAWLFALGLGFLLLAKSKHLISGYTSPKPFDTSETQRCVEYDIRVVDDWLNHLGRYLGSDGVDAIQRRDILELGPGSDLGIGTYLIAQGAGSYSACDVHALAFSAPDSLYQELLGRLRTMLPSDSVGSAQEELTRTRSGDPSRLKYVVRDDFDLEAAFGEDAIDVVFSQAAFEHFDDVASTVRGLTRVCRRGAVIVAEIDLMTHSRWIRDADPNNIYRFPGWLYRLFGFRGAPNRLRPQDYVEAFEQNGWSDISVVPLMTTDVTGAWSAEFREADAQMDVLSFVLCARKAATSEA